MLEPYYNDDAVLRFQILLEEVTRAKPGSPGNRFVPPDNQSLGKLEARFHHVLYGRRGTGKSSILRKVESNLRGTGHLVAWADQETFSGLSYPDVLVSTLAEIFRQFAAQIESAEVQGKRSEKRRAREANASLANVLRQAVVQLHELKSAPSEADIAWKATIAETNSSGVEWAFDVGGSSKHARAGLSRKRTRQSSTTHGNEVERRFTARKREHLERAVSTYRDLMMGISKSFPDSYVVLDDFYRLTEMDQPQIAGYFHRVVKDTAVLVEVRIDPLLDAPIRRWLTVCRTAGAS